MWASLLGTWIRRVEVSGAPLARVAQVVRDPRDHVRASRALRHGLAGGVDEDDGTTRGPSCCLQRCAVLKGLDAAFTVAGH